MMHRSSSSSVILLSGDDMAGGCLCEQSPAALCQCSAIANKAHRHAPAFCLTFGQAVRVIIALAILGEIKKIKMNREIPSALYKELACDGRCPICHWTVSRPV